MSSVISLDFSFAVEIISPWLGSISIASLVKRKKKRSKRKKEKEKKKREIGRKIEVYLAKGPRTEIAISDRDVGKSGLFGPIGPFIRR